MAEKIIVRVGWDEYGNEYNLDVTGAPHILIGGSTGSGKSVLLNTVITRMIKDRSSKEISIYLVDPKVVELKPFKRAPQVKDVATHIGHIDKMLRVLVDEMERRFSIMDQCVDSQGFSVKDVVCNKMYRKDSEGMMEEIVFPNIVIVIDEYGNLILDQNVGKRVNDNIVRIAQKGRAAGMNVILATQHPTVKVVNEQIKANCQCRIAMKVMAESDSRVILGKNGAEKLAGKGEMYINTFKNSDHEFIKVKCDYIDIAEIEQEINRAVIADYDADMGCL